ncbi:MAG: iron-containing redox enzyme family protein [Oscillatoriophycideae cyanobacterium NC_groundwater_1537_Pr4_S-0.65um_50_18]|nr:iron-containing redox enzyme family protein [Oscillatoriophycideae cyanobacterium NC_groundwater_1537_Pr4_S-0.65um_50_18]
MISQTAPVTLDLFVSEWLSQYRENAATIALFNPTISSGFSAEQKSFFCRAFYHIRGHFQDFLWFVANHTQDEVKQLILENINEEFGGMGRSHEQFYYEFAEALQVHDLVDEVVYQTTHLPFIRLYNQEHLQWLAERRHTPDALFAAFAAYEKLDNPDYENLYQLGLKFQLSQRGLIFFDVHRTVQHFEASVDLLQPIWDANPEVVQSAFEFIGQHQLDMWRQLSQHVIACGKHSQLQAV